MIRYLLVDLLAKKSFHEGRRIEWSEVAEACGIHRVTLSKMVNRRGYNSTTTNLDRLCRYFRCGIGELLEYVPDEELGGAVERSSMGAQAGTPQAKAGVTARYGKKTSKEARSQPAIDSANQSGAKPA
jgi:putative transcriptional regulator